MSQVKAKSKRSAGNANGSVLHSPEVEVLTASEAAQFLRTNDETVLRLAQTGELPGRQVDKEWRFLKSALRDWLSNEQRTSQKESLLALAGKYKDDPDLEKIVQDAYKRRGRPMTETPE